jgi:UDP-N-acetyl-D-glucosamine/UDP-N-acetyl-D-galactosamine dehydrogenase
VVRRVLQEKLGVKVAVVGLGYVGLPLAVAFGAAGPTIGYDRDERKVARLKTGTDATGELSAPELSAARDLQMTSDPAALREADFVIIAVPTPVDASNRPDLTLLLSACEVAGKNLKRGATVVIESTVYPGCTEEDCVPVLERASGSRWREGFHVGYSPERINPGDKEHSLDRIVKVVSGDDAGTLEKVAALYGSVVKAGVHRAPSIKVAEAAKVIENTQRDLNIALMNELAIIFHRMEIDTSEVLRAASTKWNFVPFHPGLVGGHCVGVDPYYLTHKAEKLGHHPEVILAGRRINDGMAGYVAEMAVKRLSREGFATRGAKAIVAGLTFKENVADLRNSKVADLVAALRAYGLEVHVHDPVADPEEAAREYGIRLESWESLPAVQLVVLAVPHRQLLTTDFAAKAARGAVFIDVQARLDARALTAAGFAVWRL